MDDRQGPQSLQGALPSLDTSPRKAGWFKRSVAALVVLALQASSFAQVTGPVLRGGYGQAKTGFTANGTLVLGGQVVGNPHQQMHDLQNPALWTAAAVSFSNSTDPSFIQPTVDQMMATIAPPAGGTGGLYLSRLYLNPVNPYAAGVGALSPVPSPTPETGSAAPTGPMIDNFEHYKRALDHAQAQIAGGNVAGGWKYTTPEAGGIVYTAKTHVGSSEAIKNMSFDSAPGTVAFAAAQSPTAGATGFFAIQGEEAKTHLGNVQQQNANLLASRLFFTQQNMGRLSPSQSGFGSRSDAAVFEQMLGSAPNLWGGNAGSGASTDPSFQLGYVRDDGSAQFFNLSDKHFRDSQIKSSWSGDSGGLEFGRDNAWFNAMVGQELKAAADKREKGLNAAAGIDMGYFQDSKALFMQGIDLYRHVNKGDWGLLDGLRTGAIGPGHPDYARARALSEDAFKQAYVFHNEYDTKLKYTKEAAAYQANQLQLGGVSNADLFGKGLNLFDKRGDPEQERLLGMLQAGQLSESHPRYQEIRGLAEARFKVAYQKALEPPKKPNPIKQIVAVVIAAIVVYFTAGLASGWAGAALGASTTATGAVATTVVTATGVTTVSVAGVAATAIGSAVGAYAGAVVGAGIQTGSMSKALAAGENSLKGGVAGILVNTALAAAGVSGVDISSSLGVSERVGQAIYNTIAGSMSQSIAYGGSFGDALVNSAISNTTSAVSAMGANAIAGANLGAVGTEIAHGALGCAAGVARSGGSEGCGAGAVGAIVAHAGAQWLDPAMGRTLSDSDVAFFSGVAGGAAAALVGGSNNVQANFGIGQTTGQNAVENNYVTQRAIINAREVIAQNCAQGCERLMNSIEQTSARTSMDLRDRCATAPEACSATLGQIADGLKELQSPQTQQAFASNPQVLERLIARQINDLDQAMRGVDFARQHPSSLEAIRTVAAAASVAGGVTLLGRVLVGACASNPGACTSFANEAAIVMSEAASGVPYSGVVSPVVGAATASTAAIANRLASAAGNATDMAQAVRQAQADLAAARAISNASAAIPTGFKPFNLDGLPAGSTAVVNASTGEIRMLTPTGALADIPAAPIPANINAIVVPQTATGIKWGGGIQDQGLPFENYLETKLPAGTRLPPNTGTFDFFDQSTGIATSAKTLDTMTGPKISDPSQIYSSLKSNVDAVVNFNGTNITGSAPLTPAMIVGKEVQVAVPQGTTPAQWAQINKAIDYANSHGVALRITVVKP